MSPPGSGTLPRSQERPPRRGLWPFVRRRPAPRRRVRVRWARLLSVGAAGLALLAVALLVGRLAFSGGRSPFQGLLPADTPLALEGEGAAVLDVLRRAAPLGPQVLDRFGLSGSRCSGRRMLFALLPQAGGDQAAARRCREAMGRAVNDLELAWEEQQAYPSAAPALQCPAGGTPTYRPEGEDFVLECRGRDHRLAYDSRTGFEDSGTAGPAVLVGLDRPEEEGGLQLLCSQPELLEPLLAAGGPRLELPGPASAPLRAVGDVASMEALIPGPWPQMAPQGRVLLWGDPAQERWSLRLPLPSPEVAVVVADALQELPPAPVAMAASPAFLRLLAPTLAEELSLAGAQAPGSVAVAMEEPFSREGWREQLARRLAGRGGTVVAASFPEASQASAWVAKTPWSGVLTGTAPGAEFEARGTAAILRLGGWAGAEPSRPTLPSGEGEAALAGWVTVEGPQGRRALYCFAAGPDAQGTWMELSRQEAPAAPPRVARDETPVIQAR